jgi:GH25 family lysozyme M1 (1,4-beta-N-acetylmuramidase)
MPSRREAAITRSVIDVSHWEDPIDFKKVAADGIVAVIANTRDRNRKAQFGQSRLAIQGAQLVFHRYTFADLHPGCHVWLLTFFVFSCFRIVVDSNVCT